MKDHSIWVEKYRPKTLDTYVGSERIKSYIGSCLEKNDIPHLLFHGVQGTGKTTLAKIIANNSNFELLYINASDERGIDTIREKIVQFAEASTFKKLKIIILDEADYITSTAQAALRNVIESFSLNTRFILTANYLEKIIEPLKSRFQVFKIEPPSKKEIYNFVSNILKSESTSFKMEDLALIINNFFPDIRKIIGICQQYSSDSELILTEDITNEKTNSLINKISSILSQHSKLDSWTEIRKIINSEDISDYIPLYSGLYDNINSYTDKYYGEISVHLAQYIWSNNTVPDKELNFMACISQIINTLKQ